LPRDHDDRRGVGLDYLLDAVSDVGALSGELWQSGG
jgi:hypothetical protein